MDVDTKVCESCQKQFRIIEPEKKFLEDRGLPLPHHCPSCRQLRRLKLRGGERTLYRTKCQKCGKDIIVAYDPSKTKNQILCREDYQHYMQETDLIVKDPLPEV